MYIKKYLTLNGSISGTVKYEAADDTTRIHVRITSDIDDIFRVYLADADGERAYAGILPESGTLSFNTEGLFDCVYITKKWPDGERICASVFADEAYTLAAPEKKAAEELNEEPLPENDCEEETGEDAAVSKVEEAFGAPALESESVNIKFHIAANESRTGVRAGTAVMDKGETSHESAPDGAKCAEDAQKEEAGTQTFEEESTSVRALRTLLLLLLYLDQTKEQDLEE